MAALKSLKPEMLVSLILPQRQVSDRATKCKNGEPCAYETVWYLINDASHQEWTACHMQIWYMKQFVPLSHFITSNLKGQHFKYC